MPYADPIKRKAASHAYYLKNKEKRMAAGLAWIRKNHERHLKNQREWAKKWREENPERAKAADAKRRAKYRQQRLANMKVFHAVEYGKLIKPKRCQLCGNETELQGHHHKGYSEEHELDVLWICNPCHQKVHHPNPYSGE